MEIHFLVLCLTAVAASSLDTPVPRFTVNLDLPAKERWNEVTSVYADQLHSLMAEMSRYTSSMGMETASILAAQLLPIIRQPYQDEMLGIAARAGLPVGQIILWNLEYDVTASNHSKLSEGCTSIVAEDANGNIYHGRNLDYGLATLRKIAIMVEFQRQGQTVYTGTTFAGYIGLMTAQKPNAFTLSQNERDHGSWWLNAAEAAKTGTNGAISFLMRDVLDHAASTFDEVVNILSTTPLIASSYLIVAGSKPGEGTVITRNQTTAVDIVRLNTTNGRWYVLQTNYDNWKPPPPSDDRRDPGIKAMDNIGRRGMSPSSLFKVLSTAPVLNDGTVFTVVMSAAQPDVYRSVLRSQI